MKLSILCASIRNRLLPNFYDSIGRAYHGEWELIIVSPYDMPIALKDKTNIKWIKDWGSPTRGWQIALVNATGEYVHYTADDCTYYSNTLDESMRLLDENPEAFITGKYLEGDAHSPVMLEDRYYYFRYHKQLEHLAKDKDYIILNVGICKTKLLLDIGGWDCRFESASIALMDFSMRIQDENANIIIQKDPILYCSWSGNPRDNLEHRPVEDAHIKHDLPLITHLRNGNPVINNRIDINNWKNAQAVWKRRFGDAI